MQFEKRVEREQARERAKSRAFEEWLAESVGNSFEGDPFAVQRAKEALRKAFFAGVAWSDGDSVVGEPGQSGVTIVAMTRIVIIRGGRRLVGSSIVGSDGLEPTDEVLALAFAEAFQSLIAQDEALTLVVNNEEAVQEEGHEYEF